MKFVKSLLLLISICLPLSSQTVGTIPYIQDMAWDSASNIHLVMFNGAKHVVKLEDILHSRSASTDTSNFVYYPVMLGSDFVEKINEDQAKQQATNSAADTLTNKPMTLWGTLHSTIGGGWVHFINCLTYTLETRSMSLTSPIMERPKSDWKPSPVTETWKRTRKWKYYTPVDQRHAQKEYKLKAKENQLNNLQDVPADFIKLFMETNNREYRHMKEDGKYKELARIDLVKLLLGANYLSKYQINYINKAVQSALLKYSYNQLPTVIIFDDMGAAVVLSLNEDGYKIEKTVFRNADKLSNTELETRKLQIEITIAHINRVNHRIFEQRLNKMYR